MSSKHIPTHRLSEVTGLGVEIHRVPGPIEDFEQHMVDLGVHRDDHYVFLFQLTGCSRYRVDFEEWVFEGRGLCYLIPGQVHEICAATGVEGWYLAVDVHLVPEAYRKLFQEVSGADRRLCPSDAETTELVQCLDMVLLRHQRATPLSKPVLHSLVSAFTGLLAEFYQRHLQGEDRQASRQEQICRRFRALVERRYREEKRPAAYAAALHLSLSYLNETVRAVTGSPVGHWIQSAVMLEARRLLYYSDKSVQEIAFELGYEDPAYFSRVFRQGVGHSPVQFRQLFRG